MPEPLARVIVLGAWLAASANAVGAAQEAANLKIVVIAGEDSVNVIKQKTAVAPVVEIRDRNNQPVANAVVRFTVRGGRNARLANGVRVVQAASDATGRAAVSALTPTGTGLVQIDVTATFQGQTIAATITQTNVATAAEAASVAGGTTGGGAGGGGLSNGAIAGIGAAGAGGVLVSTLAGGNETPEPAPNRAPAVTAVSAVPNLGLQAATVIQFSAEAPDPDNDPLTYAWDFGDSSTGTGASQTHVYNTSGTFTVRVTSTDSKQATASSQTTVTIKSLTGRWGCFTCSTPTTVYYQLTQTGATVTGTYFFPDIQLAVTGRVQTASPQISLAYTCTGQGCPFSFAGNPGADFDSMTGTTTNGTVSQTATSRRLQ